MSTDNSVVLYLYIRRERNQLSEKELGEAGFWVMVDRSGNSVAPFSSSTGLGRGKPELQEDGKSWRGMALEALGIVGKLSHSP